jgi:hypothetical protein
MNLDLVDIQSMIASTLVQGPSWKPIEDEYSTWMENSLVRPEYFSFTPDAEDEVDRFLHDLFERASDSVAEKFVSIMKKRVHEDQGSIEAINRAVYGTCAAIIRSNELSAEAFAVATGKKAQPSPALIKAWTTGQKMREYFKLSDVKAAIEGGNTKKSKKLSLYAGANDEVVEEASKAIVARAKFLLRVPKDKSIHQAVLRSTDESDISGMNVELMEAEETNIISPLKSASPQKESPMPLRNLLSRQVSEDSRKANEIWNSLVDESLAETKNVDKLKHSLAHRRKFAEKTKGFKALTTTEKVLNFVQSDVEIDKLQEVNHLRNKRAVSRTKGFDMFAKLLTGLAPIATLSHVALKRLIQTLRRTKREEGVSGGLIHFSTGLEGCSPEQNTLLWQKYSKIFQQCVTIVRLHFGQNQTEAIEATISALRACAIDFDFTDHTLVNESGIVDCLESLLRDERISNTPIHEIASSLFELLVGRLVLYDANNDHSLPVDHSSISRGLISVLERILHSRTDSSSSQASASAVVETNLPPINPTHLAMQYSSITLPNDPIRLGHTIVFWMKRRFSDSLDPPFSFKNLKGKLVKRTAADNEELGKILEVFPDSKKVRVIWENGKENEFTIGDNDQSQVKLVDPSIKGYIFSKGTVVALDSELPSQAPHLLELNGVLTDEGKMIITYGLQGKDPLKLVSNKISSNIWNQIAIVFDYNLNLTLFVNGEYATSSGFPLTDIWKPKEIESAHPVAANYKFNETVAVETNHALIWFHPSTLFSEGGRLTVANSSYPNDAGEYLLPGVNGNSVTYFTGQNFSVNVLGNETATEDWGFKLFYRGISANEFHQWNNICSRLPFYVGQPPPYLTGSEANPLKGAAIHLEGFQVINDRFSKSQLQSLPVPSGLSADDDVSESILIKRLSILRRAVDNLENLADTSMKSHFGSSGLVSTLFRLMDHPSSTVKCATLQVAKSILPLLNYDVIQESVRSIGNGDYIEYLIDAIGTSQNPWLLRARHLMNSGKNLVHESSIYSRSKTSIYISLIRSFAQSKEGDSNHIMKKLLHNLVPTAISILRRLKAALIEERELQHKVDVNDLLKTYAHDLEDATSVITLLSILGGSTNSVTFGTSVVYIDPHSGVNEEAIYLGHADPVKAFATKSPGADSDGQYAAILLKRQEMQYVVVPKQNIASTNEGYLHFEQFVHNNFNLEQLLLLLSEILEVDSVDHRSKPVVQDGKVTIDKVFESAHPYADNAEFDEEVFINNAESLEIIFDDKSATEKDCDYLYFWSDASKSKQYGDVYSGRKGTQNWPGCEGRQSLIIPANSFYYTFTSDASNNVSLTFYDSMSQQR